jgi:hypothetical protein
MGRVAVSVVLMCVTVAAVVAQQGTTKAKPGVREVQVPFAALKLSATLKIGRTADWVLVADGGVWIASTSCCELIRRRIKSLRKSAFQAKHVRVLHLGSEVYGFQSVTRNRR